MKTSLLFTAFVKTVSSLCETSLDVVTVRCYQCLVSDETAAPGRQIGIRIEGDTAVRVEAHRERLQRRVGSVKVTFSDAVRDALLVGLHEVEHEGVTRGEAGSNVSKIKRGE